MEHAQHDDHGTLRASDLHEEIEVGLGTGCQRFRRGSPEVSLLEQRRWIQRWSSERLARYLDVAELCIRRYRCR